MNKDKLKKFCVNRLKKLNLFTQNYIMQMEFEIDEIEQQNYFKFYEDMLQRKITNRPNPNGLLVPFLLHITSVDPIKENIKNQIYYEGAMPDIDCDFEEGARDKVHDYLSDKYGKNNVLFIGTQSELGLKSAIKDVARVLEVPYMEVNTITKLIPNDMKTVEEVYDIKEIKSFFDKYPKLTNHVKRLLKSFRQYGVHAGGILVSSVNLHNVCPIIKSAKNFASGWKESGTVRELEYMGFVKFDVLGLNTLTQIKACVQSINNRHGLNLSEIEHHENFNFNDINVYKNIYWSGKLNNIFQFNDALGKKWCKELRPKSLENLGDINTLIRPGCLAANVPVTYMNRQCGEKYSMLDIEKEIVEPTYGLLLYQEQIMRLISACTNNKIKLSEADIIRRKLEKKDIDTVKYLSDMILQSNVLSKQESTDIVNQIVLQGGYTFNKSHAIAYSYLSYLQAWIKHYYPLEFWCVALQQAIKKEDKLHTFIMSAIGEGITIESIDINNSEMNFSIKDDKIYCGFLMAKGVGEKRIIPMMKSRKEKLFENFDDFLSRVEDKEFTIPKTLMEPLIKSGAIGSLGYNTATMINWYDKYRNKKSKDIITIEPVEELIDKQLQQLEVDVLGFNLKYDVFSKIKKQLIANGSAPVSTLNKLIANNEAVNNIPFFGIIADIKTKTTKTGKQYKHIFITDNVAKIKIKIWGNEFDKYCEHIYKGNIVMVYLSYNEWGINLQKRQHSIFTIN